MGAVHELRIRSNNFVAALDNTIIMIVNEHQEELVNLNREQLKDEHKTALDQPITPPYSTTTKSYKGFSTPDLFDTGTMQASMKIRVNKGFYSIMAFTDYVPKLLAQYGKNIFGIAPSKQDKAKAVTTKALQESYRKNVVRK